LARPGGLAVARRPRGPGPGQHRVGSSAEPFRAAGAGRAEAETAVRARRGGGHSRGAGAAWLLPREPAEHEHRQADAADDRRDPAPGEILTGFELEQGVSRGPVALTSRRP